MVNDAELSHGRQAVALLRGSACRLRMRTHARGRTLCLVALLVLVAITPYVAASGGRDADVTLSADSLSKDASPGSPAEYTITVHNSGDVDITVQLSTSQEPGGCQGYSSAIEQVPGTIPTGSSEQVVLTVNITDDSSEAVADDCETTVTATANSAEAGAPGAPAQADLTVTTTKSEGSGNAAFAVELSASPTSKNYNGDDEEVEFIVNVKNSGQSQASISLEITDSSSCRSDLSSDIDPVTMTLQSDEDDDATVTIAVPDGEQTEAGSHCFIVRATVTNDPNQQNQAQDNLSLTLNIPELHECDATISPSTMNIAPGSSETGTFELDNAGNSDWTVTFGKSGQKASWVTPSQSTRLLEYDNGNGDASFTFTVSPDDSLAADSTTQIEIIGKDGNSPRCSVMLSVTVGQSHGVATSLSNDYLHNIQPGTSSSTHLTITNQGNGNDLFSIGHTPMPTGWTVTLASSSVTLEGKHTSGSGDQESVEVSVFVPTNALADETVTITFTVTSSGASSVESTEELDVSVAERHAVQGNVLSNSQTGRPYEKILFTVSVTNDGNVRDSFRLQACDPAQNNCVSPAWPTRYVDGAGQEITQIALDAAESADVYLEVEIPDEDEGVSLSINIKVTVVSAPSQVYVHTVDATVSKYVYLMQLILANPQGAPDSTSVTLPPGGETSIDMLVSDVGNSTYTEYATFFVTGMDSTVSRELTVNGVPYTLNADYFEIPITAGNQSFDVRIKLSIMSSDQSLNGEVGTVQICAASLRNTAEPSCISVVVTISTVHSLSLEVIDGPHRNITHPDYADFRVLITNDGNIEEEIEITTTEGLRGWTVDLNIDELELGAGEVQEILVRVKPPVELSSSDDFEFTLIVTPTYSEVHAQPVDLTVSANTDQSMFGFSSATWNIVSWVIIGTLALAILGLIFSNRRRSSRV